MKDSIQLSYETLTEALKLNQAAQHRLLEDAAQQTETRDRLINTLNAAKSATFNAIGSFSDVPTANNKSRLDDFRMAEIEAEKALQDFDAQNGFDDMDLLLSSERSLKTKLKNIRVSEGADSLQTELERLKEKLKTDLPRLLALNSAIHQVPPGLLDVEKFLVKQLNLRRAYEGEYQNILHELNFEGDVL